MRTVLGILLWPVAVLFHAGLEILVWFRPSIAHGRCVFPDTVRELIESAIVIEVHYAELSVEEPTEPGQLGTPMSFRSLGFVRLVSDRDRRRVVRSVLRANRECLGGFLCLDAEYALRLESPAGPAELIICFRCMQVWVKAEVEGAGRYYPITARPQLLLAGLLQAAGISAPAAERPTDSTRVTLTQGEAAGE